MPITLVLDLARNALWMVLVLAGPILVTAMLVGLAVSILQTITSIQEQTLSFVPKLLAVGLVIVMLLPWMIQQMLRYTSELFRALPGLIG